MNRRAWLGIVYAAAFLLGCKAQKPFPQRKIVYPPQMEISAALNQALQEGRKSCDMGRPYDLDARVDNTGAWVFVFTFLPIVPGDNLMVIVGTNGVRVTSLL